MKYTCVRLHPCSILITGFMVYSPSIQYILLYSYYSIKYTVYCIQYIVLYYHITMYTVDYCIINNSRSFTIDYKLKWDKNIPLIQWQFHMQLYAARFIPR